jgi:hypothetical protein
MSGQVSGVNEWRDGEEMKALTVGGIRLTPPVPFRALFSRRPGGGEDFYCVSRVGHDVRAGPRLLVLPQETANAPH